MKKEAILLLFLLINLDLVSAQEVTILGNTYPLIYVVPILFILIITLFFLVLLIKDNISSIKLPKINFKAKHKKTPIKEIHVDYKTKLGLLKERLNRLGPKESLNELDELIKQFFKDKFAIKHEFALGELGSIIKGHDKDVAIANKISTLKFSGNPVNIFQVKALVDDFEYLLKEYKIKINISEFGFWGRVGYNFATLFKSKHKVEHKELKKINLAEVPTPTKIKEHHVHKEGIFTRFFHLFKSKHKIEHVKIEHHIKHEVKHTKEPGFWKRVKINFLSMFKVQHKTEHKELRINLKEVPVHVKIGPQIHKPGVFASFFSLFKRKHKVEHRVEHHIKHIVKHSGPGFWKRVKINFLSMFKTKHKIEHIELKKINLAEVPAPINIKSHKKRIGFFKNIKIRILKSKILSVIEDGMIVVNLNPMIAKRYYAIALLDYHKLPIDEDKEIANGLKNLHDKILKAKSSEKTFLDTSKKLIDIKHSGKRVSRESISIINTLKNFIRGEELFVSTRLKNFSSRLKHEERKLKHFVNKEDDLFKEDKKKLEHLLKKKENGLEEGLDKIENKEHRFVNKIKNIFRTKKSAKLYRIIPNANALSKHHHVTQKSYPQINIQNIKQKILKKENKALKLLNEEKNELYNKLIKLEGAKRNNFK